MLRIARILFLDSLSDQGVLARPEWTSWKPFGEEKGTGYFILPGERKRCVNRQQPFGTEEWQAKIAAALGLESTLRRRGRPLKASEK